VSYRVEFSHQAAKELQRLDRITAGRIEARIEELARDPLSPRLSRQMETARDRRYSRVGDWRIIYRLNEAAGTLDIAAIRPRSRAYR
jgi:mRNA interferase RelE/StbE